MIFKIVHLDSQLSAIKKQKNEKVIYTIFCNYFKRNI